jgi:hypothetical protein
MKRQLVALLEVIGGIPVLVLLILGLPFLLAYLAADALRRKWRMA